MGERAEALSDGSEAELMQLVSSANIACGQHAGDLLTMEATVLLAAKSDVAVGAHPGYSDRANFGRLSVRMPATQVVRLVYEQIRSLGNLARAHHRELVHVKPHGALYHDAAANPSIAEAIASGAAQWSRNLILVGLAGSPVLDVWRDRGFAVAPEGFADRTYEPDGTLRTRNLHGAVITDRNKAAQQALRIVTKGSVLTSAGTELTVRAETICVHSDTPGAIEILKAVREELIKGGISIECLKPSN